MKIYLVGGAVRDQLLGQPIKERDWVVVGATPEQLLNLGYRPVGKDFPVFLHPETHEEYALARTERKTGPGYTGFSFHAAPNVSLEQDLLRRDLTINALAQDPETGTIIDPYAGQLDLQQRILRHVSPAFREDPVRILRIARFAARYASLGFQIAPETLTLMQEMVAAGEINALVAERVWQELVRALGEPCPAEFFRVLKNCGALKILFPALADLFNVTFDVSPNTLTNWGDYSLTLLDKAAQITADPAIRFAVLTRHFDKTAVAQTDELRTDISSIKQLSMRYRIPQEYSDLAYLANRYYPTLKNVTQLDATQLLQLLERTDALRRYTRFEQLITACAIHLHKFNQDMMTYLTTAVSVVKQIDIQDLLAQSLEGGALADAIRSKRLQALAKFLQNSAIK